MLEPELQQVAGKRSCGDAEECPGIFIRGANAYIIGTDTNSGAVAPLGRVGAHERVVGLPVEQLVEAYHNLPPELRNGATHGS